MPEKEKDNVRPTEKEGEFQEILQKAKEERNAKTGKLTEEALLDSFIKHVVLTLFVEYCNKQEKPKETASALLKQWSDTASSGSTKAFEELDEERKKESETFPNINSLFSGIFGLNDKTELDEYSDIFKKALGTVVTEINTIISTLPETKGTK